MALTNNIITMYMMHTTRKKNKKTLPYNNLCTRLLYQHQKYQSVQLQQKCFEKKISKG